MVEMVKIDDISAVPKLRVFLVEDSPTIRESLIGALEELCPVTVVDTADDEPSAVKWLAEHHARCDLAIIDIFLRTGSGLGVLKGARGIWPQLPLVVLSNYATPAMVQRCREQGAVRVFDKSTQLDALLLFCNELARTSMHGARSM